MDKTVALPGAPFSHENGVLSWHDLLMTARLRRSVYAAFGVGEHVTVRASEASATGFRGYTLPLVVAQPNIVDTFIGAALAASATTVKSAKKGFWGYGGGVPMEGAGSHRIAIVGDAGTFTDPDSFAWEAGRVRHENRETT